MEEYLTIKEAAKASKMCVKTIWNWIKRGLPKYGSEGKRLVKAVDLAKWIDGGAR